MTATINPRTPTVSNHRVRTGDFWGSRPAVIQSTNYELRRVASNDAETQRSLLVRLTALALSCAATAARLRDQRHAGCRICAYRSAAGVTPSRYCSAQAARPPDRSRAATASAPCWAAPLAYATLASRVSQQHACSSVRSGGVSGAFTRCTPWRVLQDAACYSDAPQILRRRNKRLRAALAFWSQNTAPPTAHFQDATSVFSRRGRTIGVKAAPLLDACIRQHTTHKPPAH